MPAVQYFLLAFPVAKNTALVMSNHTPLLDASEAGIHHIPSNSTQKLAPSFWATGGGIMMIVPSGELVNLVTKAHY